MGLKRRLGAYIKNRWSGPPLTVAHIQAEIIKAGQEAAALQATLAQNREWNPAQILGGHFGFENKIISSYADGGSIHVDALMAAAAVKAATATGLNFSTSTREVRSSFSMAKSTKLFLEVCSEDESNSVLLAANISNFDAGPFYGDGGSAYAQCKENKAQLEKYAPGFGEAYDFALPNIRSYDAIQEKLAAKKGRINDLKALVSGLRPIAASYGADANELLFDADVRVKKIHHANSYGILTDLKSYVSANAAKAKAARPLPDAFAAGSVSAVNDLTIENISYLFGMVQQIGNAPAGIDTTEMQEALCKTYLELRDTADPGAFDLDRICKTFDDLAPGGKASETLRAIVDKQQTLAQPAHTRAEAPTISVSG